MGKVYWSKIAQSDLENIGNFIAIDAPIFAIDFIENLLRHTRNLENYPNIGRIVPEFDDKNLREIIFYNYRIVYEIRNNNIYIVSVSHCSMDIVKKSKKEKWEIG